eukprot:TRINITY_DN9218_c2_g1_i2.p1 TRINITY_DN9218_c2_g1~~TRINITY_DN9218_c2_g1_i2.p1  ORF type:complete len:1293 (+),score=241.21 TRINITY_DN9218_c2_g1_i2:36-3914(+)
MPDPRPYHDIGVISGIDDFTAAEGIIECVAVGYGIVVLGLSTGDIQVVAGPTRETVFMITCISGGRVDRLQVLEKKEAILSVESSKDHGGRTCAVLYQFTERAFKGNLVTHTIPVTGGNITSVAACKYTDSMVVSTQHIATLYHLQADPEGGDFVVPVAEIHTPVMLVHVVVLGNVVGYASADVLWCVRVESGEGENGGETRHDDIERCPLASGGTQAVIDDAYLEVKFYKRNNGSPSSSTESYSPSEAASSSRKFIGMLMSAQGSVTSCVNPQPISPRRYAFSKKRTTHITLIHADGTENEVTNWDTHRTLEVTGGFNHTDHPVFFLAPTSGSCKLLYKKRVSHEGDFKHISLTPCNTGTTLTVGTASVDIRLLTITSNRGHVMDLRGEGICDYTFGSPCRICCSNDMFVFVFTQSGALETYPLRGRTPQEGLRTANGVPWMSPFVKMASHLQTKIPFSPVLQMACSDETLFMLHEPHAISHPYEDSEPRGSWNTNVGSGSGGGSPHLKAGRMRAASAASSVSSAPGIIVTNAARENHFGTGCCNGSSGRLASPAELLQEVLKEHKRRAFINEALSIPVIHEGYLALQSKISSLKVAAATLGQTVNVSSLTVQMELNNTITLGESLASILGDIYLKMEQAAKKQKLQDSPKSPEATGSSKSGWSQSIGDGLSERDTNSVTGSCADPPLTGTWDEALNLSLNRDPRSSMHSTSTPTDSIKRSWAFYAFCDRTFRQVVHLLRKDQWSLMSYLEQTLFSDQRPKMLSSTPSKPFVPEELGNSLLAVYAKTMPHKLCSVVWDSWLGRAKGGMACFSAGQAGRLLLEGIKRGPGMLSGQQCMETELSTRTMSFKSDVDDVVRIEGLASSWGYVNPKEQFVLGLLLLEDGDIRGCVDALSTVDGSALIELASSSRHLWEPDVHDTDIDDEMLHLTLPTASLAALAEAVQHPSPHPSSLTMGSLIALYFPWFLLPVLVAARDKFLLPISSAARLFNMASHQPGLLLSKFLVHCITSHGPVCTSIGTPKRRKPRAHNNEVALQTYTACHLLKEIVECGQKCQARDIMLEISSSQGTPPQEVWIRGLNIGDNIPKLPRLSEFIKMMETERELGKVSCFEGRPCWMEGLTAEQEGEISGTAEEELAYSYQALRSLLWANEVDEQVSKGILGSLSDGSDLCSSTNYINLAVVVLVKAARIPEAMTLLEPHLSPSRMLAFALTHCNTDPSHWKPLVTHLITTNNKSLLTLLLNKLATHLSLQGFIDLLPADGNTRFFLPFITVAFDAHKTTLLQDPTADDALA